MSITLFISISIAFIATLLLTPRWIRFIEALGLTGMDVHKRERPRVAEMGGPAVLSGFLLGIFALIGARVFLYGLSDGLIEMFAAITTILLTCFIGVLDDLSGLSKLREKDEHGNIKRVGLPKWLKPLLTLPAAIPLMVILAGDHSVNLPFFGVMELGLIYPLLLIPVGIMGASNAVNMLAGINGLEAGLGSVLLAALGVFSLAVGSFTAAAIALVFAGALLAFLKWNWCPARIMPGDSLLYAIGGAVAVVAILGNIEKFALYIFFLWFAEVILKSRSRFKAQSFGVVQPDGTIAAPPGRIFSLTHAVMRLGRLKEWKISATLIIIQLLISGALLVVYWPH